MADDGRTTAEYERISSKHVTKRKEKQWVSVHCPNCKALLVEPEYIWVVETKGIWVLATGRNKVQPRVNPLGKWNNIKKKGTSQRLISCKHCPSIIVGAMFKEGYKCGYEFEETKKHGPELSYKFYNDSDRARYVLVKTDKQRQQAAVCNRSSLRLDDPAPTDIERSILKDFGLDESLAEKLIKLVGFVPVMEDEGIKQIRREFFQQFGLKYQNKDCENNGFVALIALLDKFYGTVKKWRSFHEKAKGLQPDFQGKLNDFQKQVQTRLNKKKPFIEEIKDKQELRKRLFEQLGFDYLDSDTVVAPKHPYDPQLENRVFISIDLRSANFNILRLLTEGTEGTWEECVRQIGEETKPTNPDVITLLSQSKKRRQEILGKICPKRTATAERFVLELMWREVQKEMVSMFKDDYEGPFFASNDELYIIVNFGSEHKVAGMINYLKEQLKRVFNKEKRLFRVEGFKLYVVDFNNSNDAEPTKPTHQNQQERQSYADEWEDDFSVVFKQPTDHFYIRLDMEKQIPQLKHIHAGHYLDAFARCKLINKDSPFDSVKVMEVLEHLRNKK